MNMQDRMLQLVLSDEKLIKTYDIEPYKYTTLHDALYSEDPIITSIAMIIDSIKDNFDESDMKALYTRIQHHLNDTLLI